MKTDAVAYRRTCWNQDDLYRPPTSLLDMLGAHLVRSFYYQNSMRTSTWSIMSVTDDHPPTVLTVWRAHQRLSATILRVVLEDTFLSSPLPDLLRHHSRSSAVFRLLRRQTASSSHPNRDVSLKLVMISIEYRMCRARSRTKQVTGRQGPSIASLEPRVLSVHVSVLRCDIEISPLDLMLPEQRRYLAINTTQYSVPRFPIQLDPPSG
ncbi:hypothetical protein AB1N83_002236 [Pleurotus pulmonarius]